MAAFPSSLAQVTPRSDVMTGAFEPGFVGEAEFNRYPIRVVRIGEVDISSGRLLLADPFWMSAKDDVLSASSTGRR